MLKTGPLVETLYLWDEIYPRSTAVHQINYDGPARSSKCIYAATFDTNFNSLNIDLIGPLASDLCQPRQHWQNELYLCYTSRGKDDFLKERVYTKTGNDPSMTIHLKSVKIT